MDMASHSRIPSKPNLEVVNVGERLDDTQPIIRLPHQGVPQLDKTDALPSEPLLLEETDKIPHLVSESDPGNPMDLLETEDLRCEPADLLGEKLSVGDYSAVFHIATEILSTNPNDTSAQTHLAQAKEILLRMYESKIGSMDRIPKVLLPEREIIWRDLDPKSSFILSRIDGQFSYEDILDISGLSRFETCKILSELIKNGIIE